MKIQLQHYFSNMNTTEPIKISSFKDAFRRTNWSRIESTNEYEKWVFNEQSDLWTILPKGENSNNYKYYQQKNIKLLLYTLKLPENDENFIEIYNQLSGYNYKLINRIVNNGNYKGSAIPFEVANNVPQKNINSFRIFYSSRRSKFVPIEHFEFNHTQNGSFIIPISIKAEQQADMLWEEPSPTNKVIREYLDTVERMLTIKITNEEAFAKEAMEQEIDSRIIKSFLSESIGIAKYIRKYESSIDEISITSHGNPFLDFNLSDHQKKFKKIELNEVMTIPDNFITYLEKKEDEANDETIEASNATVDVIVDLVSSNGKAQFSVVAINKKPVKKPFVAISHQLTKARINFVADSLKSQNIIEVHGDIFKAKGKAGVIVIDDIKESIMNQMSFEDDENKD